MSCVHVAALQLAPVSYVFPMQTRQCNSAFASRTFTVPYFRRHLPMISLKSASLKLRYEPLTTMCSLNSSSVTSEYGESEPMRLFGIKAFPRQPIKKAVGCFAKGKSVEDLLKEQILKKEYYNGNGGGSGRKPPGGGGGGGSGDEAPWDGEEFKQVTLATLGIICVCIYIAERAQINALARDSLQYLFTRKQSARIKRVIEPLNKFLQRMRGEENQLEHETITTPNSTRDSDDDDDSDTSDEDDE